MISFLSVIGLCKDIKKWSNCEIFPIISFFRDKQSFCILFIFSILLLMGWGNPFSLGGEDLGEQGAGGQDFSIKVKEGEENEPMLLSSKIERILRLTKRAGEYRRRQIKRIDSFLSSVGDFSRFLKDSERIESEITRLIQGGSESLHLLLREDLMSIFSSEGINLLKEEFENLQLFSSAAAVQEDLKQGEKLLEEADEEEIRLFLTRLREIESEDFTRLENASDFLGLLKEIAVIAEDRESLLRRIEEWGQKDLTLFQKNPGLSWGLLSLEDKAELTRLQENFEDLLSDLTAWENQVKELGEKEAVQKGGAILDWENRESLLIIMSMIDSKMDSWADQILQKGEPLSSFSFSTQGEKILAEIGQNHLGLFYETGKGIKETLRYYPSFFYRESQPVLSLLLFLPEK